MKCPKCSNRTEFYIDLIEENLIRTGLDIGYNDEDPELFDINTFDDRVIEINLVEAAPRGYSKCRQCEHEAPTKDFDDGAMPYPVQEETEEVK